jgi:V8-like Glu-specific endopeptidase
MRVRKVGRTTGCTEGYVINADVRLTARHMKTSSASGPVRFRRQVLCTQFGMGGDSGSIVVNDRNEVVGLYAGGTERGCWFNRIEHVCDLLNIEIAK